MPLDASAGPPDPKPGRRGLRASEITLLLAVAAAVLGLALQAVLPH